LHTNQPQKLFSDLLHAHPVDILVVQQAQRFATIPAEEQVLNNITLLSFSNKFKLTNHEYRYSGKP
jgi:hypothetical protein